MQIFSILITYCFCWFVVFIALNFYYDVINKNKPKNPALKAVYISFLIISCLLFLAYCK